MKKTKLRKARETAELYAQIADPVIRQKFWEQGQREICQSKTKYLTEGAADSRAYYYDNESRRTSASKKKSKTYKCCWCGFFHITLNGRK